MRISISSLVGEGQRAQREEINLVPQTYSNMSVNDNPSFLLATVQKEGINLVHQLKARTIVTCQQMLIHLSPWQQYRRKKLILCPR